MCLARRQNAGLARIHIVVDDHRPMATELHKHRLAVLRREAREMSARGGGAGEGDQAGLVLGNQVARNLRWNTEHNIEHTRRQARAMERARDLEGAAGGFLQPLLRTTEQPAATAPGIFRAGSLIGKFQGEKPATAPFG